MSINYNNIYNNIISPESISEEKKQKALDNNLSLLYNKLHSDTTVVEDKIYNKNIGEIFNNIQSSFETPYSVTPAKKSLTELSEDEKFSSTAERFMDKIGRNENIFEYLRDSEYSLSAAAKRAIEVGDWDKQTQEDYIYLSEQFKNSKLKGFREHVGLIKDLGFDLVTDPLNVLALLFAIPSGGTSFAGRAALGEAARQGTKQLLKQSLKNSKPLATITAAEGAGWEGLYDYFQQDINVDLGLIDSIDLQQTALSGLTGGLIGGGLGGTIGTVLNARQGSKYLKFAEKEYKYANPSDIEFVGPKTREQVELDWQIDKTLDTENNLGVIPEITEGVIKRYDAFNNFAKYGFAKAFGKSTSEFLDLVDDEPLIRNFLRKLRYDYDVGILTEGKEGATKANLADGTVSEFTYGEYYGRMFGYFTTKLAKAFNPVGYTSFWGKLTLEDNFALKTLLRDKTLNVNNVKSRLKDGTYNYIELQRIDNKNIKTEKTIKITPVIEKAYIDLRTLLDEGYVEANKLNLFRKGTVLQSGFFPRLYKYDILERNRKEFEDILIEKGHADPINEKDLIDVEITLDDGTTKIVKGSRKGQLGKDQEIFFDAEGTPMDFVELANGDMNLAKELKANKIVQDMLDERFTPYELRVKGQSNAQGYLQPRRFTDIEDFEIDKFLEDDVEVILNNYFTNLSQSLARKKYFGATLAEFSKKELTPIITSLRNAVDSNGKKKYSTEEITQIQKNLTRVFRRATGLDTFSNYGLNNNRKLRAAKDFIILSQQMSSLPFATVSSVTEPLILLSRASGLDGIPVVRDIAVGIVKQGAVIGERLFKTIQRTTGKKVGNYSDLEDEVWDEIYQTGLALEQAVFERIEGLAGEAIENPYMKRAQQFFFNSNLLAPWTKAVQLASFTTGKRIIKQHAEKLATGKTLYGNLTDSKRKQIIKELNQLGIDENEAIAWYNKSLNEQGRFDENLSKGIDGRGNDIPEGNGEFYKRNVLGGANRFTKEIILNPRAAEANRPDWFGRPDAQFLIQFAGYPTVFNNTILKRFINELSPVKRDANKKFGLTYNETFSHNAPKTAMTALLMTSVAYLGNELRSNGKATIDYSTNKPKDISEIIGDAVRRWGGFGPLDYAYRYREEDERNVGGFTSLLKAIGGPFPQDIIDMVLYRKGMLEGLVVPNLPYYGAYDNIFGEGTKKNLRAMARGTYAEEVPKDENLFKYAKGGIVKNVPNVKDEPDEMQSRVTGQPFNSTAEFVQDEEDRALKGQMKGLGL
jgi:hypothetical protein